MKLFTFLPKWKRVSLILHCSQACNGGVQSCCLIVFNKHTELFTNSQFFQLKKQIRIWGKEKHSHFSWYSFPYNFLVIYFSIFHYFIFYYKNFVVYFPPVTRRKQDVHSWLPCWALYLKWRASSLRVSSLLSLFQR